MLIGAHVSTASAHHPSRFVWRTAVLTASLGIGLASGVLAPSKGAAQPMTAAHEAVAARTDHQRPNIIVIQTDDQDTASVTHRVMPHVVSLLARHGTTFSDYIDSGPLCCPSRAVMLTGQYGHNNGVLWNNPNPYGDLRGKHNTLPVWLQRAGYRTAHLGKYLNLYASATGDPNEVAPGWDEWYTALEPTNGPPSTTTQTYYDYTLRQNGHPVTYGSRPRDYITRVLNDKAVRLIHRLVPHQRPLFMALDQIAPHTAPNTDPRCQHSALPAPRDLNRFVNKKLSQPPSFNEADVSDKPSFVRARPRLTANDIAELKRKNGCRLAALREVDRGVKRVVTALRREHELGNTAIFYTSDNGFLLGEHRVIDKVDPYEEALHVPFIVRLPRRFSGRHGAPPKLGSTVANVDVAPTILRLAGARPCNRPGHCRVLDGRSLLRTIRSHGRHWPRQRAILLELRGLRGQNFSPCHYQGVRTRDRVLVHYLGAAQQREAEPCHRDNEFEHYDLGSDPFELDNLYPATPGTPAATSERSLTRTLVQLSDCAGIRGRDPEPASGHYCE
jgi:N-acetylglucosamine-6-sulfatase